MERRAVKADPAFMQTAALRPHLRLVVSDGEVLKPPAGPTPAERLIDFAGVRPGLRIIEFTFGPARLAWRFQAAGCDVVTVDLAHTPPDALPAEWIGAFDLAVTACVLHQAPDATHLLAAVAECVRPGGSCAGLEPAREDFAANLRGLTASAGLSLFQAQQETPSSALFWRARVPALQLLNPPSLSLAA